MDPNPWPMHLLNALRLGRPLAMEMPPPEEGRRAFVRIRPLTGEADRAAQAERWVRSDRGRGFVLTHRTYDASLLDGYDYDIGAVEVRRATAEDEADLLKVLASWDLAPTQFSYAWDTADPT